MATDPAPASGPAALLARAPRFVWYAICAILFALAAKVFTSDNVSIDWSTFKIEASARERAMLESERQDLLRDRDTLIAVRDQLHQRELALARLEPALQYCQERRDEYLAKVNAIEVQARACTAQNPALGNAIQAARALPPLKLDSIKLNGLKLQPLPRPAASAPGAARPQLRSLEELGIRRTQ